jgi:6-phosphofructokinase
MLALGDGGPGAKGWIPCSSSGLMKTTEDMAANGIDRIGLITSGGDCGGLNAVIKGAALAARARGISAVVVPNGYAGLYNLIEMQSLVELTPSRLDAVQVGLAGSEAGHSRVHIGKIPDPEKYGRIKAGLRRHGVSALVISGGDDTGSVIVDLDRQGIPCVHAPKTMDLDLQPYSVGADSTINRIAQFVRDLRTTAVTHNRMLVVEVFGRYAGHTAFRGGVAGEADCILIPEIQVDFEVVYRHARERYMRRIRTSDVNAGTYMIVVAEGTRNESGEYFTDAAKKVDSFGNQRLSGAGQYVADRLEEMIRQDDRIKPFMIEQGMYVETLYEYPEIRVVNPTHLVRCGQTSAYDVNFGMQAGAAAVHLLIHGQKGVTVVDVRGSQIRYMPTALAIRRREVDLKQVQLFEQMGFCFGRKPVDYCPHFTELDGDQPPPRDF